MTIHKCLVCERIFKRKSHLRSHLYSRKKPCVPLVINETSDLRQMKAPELLLSQVPSNGDNNQPSLVHHSQENMSQLDLSNSDQNINSNNQTPNSSLTKKLKKLFTCEKCKQTFTRKASLKKHILNRCIMSDKQQELNKDKKYHCVHCTTGFGRVDNKNKHEKSCRLSVLINISNINNASADHSYNTTNNTTNNINNSTNNTTNNNITNIQNTINLVSYSKENMDWITPELWCNLFRIQERGVCGLIKLVNFNPNHPENHNILGIEFDSKFISIFRKHGWKGENCNAFCRRILQRMYGELEKKYSEYLADGGIDDLTKRCFSRFKRKMDSGNYEMMTDRLIEVEIPLTICNNKKMVEKTRKLIAEQKERKKYLIKLQQQKEILQNKQEAIQRQST